MYNKLNKLIEKEYLNVQEISKKFKVTSRNVRRIISALAEEKSEELLFKDSTNIWQVHRLLLPKFKPQRVRKQKYYALSIDPPNSLTTKEIDEIMEFVFDRMENQNIEINYVVEKKKSNSHHHLHCFINCNQKKKLIENLKLGFSNISYHQTDIFDLEGWKNYITKEGNLIKTLKNEEY